MNELEVTYIFETIEKIADELRQVLGEGYQVIIHSSHIHCEYDKAKL